MTFRVLLFVTKLPSLTHEQFMAYYRDKHTPLLQELTGEDFPRVQRRLDLQGPNLIPNMPPLDFDCITELVFDDAEHFQRYVARASEGEALQRREADEDMFALREKIRCYVVGENVIAK